MPELQMDVAVANRFISSLSKSLQALCHGCMDFDSGIEIVGYINVNIDSGSKVDYVLNEKVLKSTTNSMTFVSNSFLARKEQQKQTRDGACSPIPDISQQSPMLPQYQNRFRGSLHGSHPRNVDQMSFAQRGSQKRSWTALERDWRMSPKKQREGRLPHTSTPKSTTATPSTYPLAASSASSPADGSFKYPQTSSHGLETNIEEPEINIKKEVFDSDSDKTNQNDHDPCQPSDQETHDYSDETPKTDICIKNDPDALTTTTEDESQIGEEAGNNPSTDFKDTFLDPAPSEDNPDNTEDNKHEEQNDDDDQLSTSHLAGKTSHEVEADNEDQSATAEDITAENMATGSEMPADYDEAGEEGAYPQSVYSDAGEGSNDTGQFEVIEIDDEDEDVQAMFGGSRDIQDYKFDIPKHRGSHSHDSQSRIRLSQTVAAQWSHFQDVPSHSIHAFDFSPVQIPSKEDSRYDPVTHRFICPVCNNSYLTYASMRGHIKLKHQGRYEIYCEICGKGFQRKIHLLGHMAMHGQPMNFECSVCGAKYAHKTSLRAHERLSHGIVQ